ncbi:MAG TPA: hypothetical protein HA282_00745 [Nanoarchaeota archaeon]|nr:MAG: hypothetical protein QT01_C0002G0032 [archaeon GW2011_AR6]MBS3083124.1 hypothetical protein [Candidatus Pacearchaeota archaeon]HIH34285.1 hypothetical protein [Nanoarchaeota archaeon]HIH65730.1 hypothetical protein [Nanoarchaeota archaeon]
MFEMVSITLSIPEETKQKMAKFQEVNWSGLVRKSIEEKVKELSLREEILRDLEKEREITGWAVNLQRKGREGRFEELKKKGLI